jgi:hypothetical protein
VVETLDDIFDARASRLAKIKDQYDRKPPYDPHMLQEAGQSYRANINTGEMEALIDNETAEATQTVISATPIAVFKSRGVPLQMRTDLAYAYHEFLWQAGSFDLFDFTDKCHFETNAYGYAAATFTGNSDWRPRWQTHFELRFPEDATPDLTKLTEFAVHTRMTLEELFNAIEFDPDEVADGWVKGWNVKEVRRFLIDQIYGNPADTDEMFYTNEYLNASQALRDGTGWAATSTRFRKVKITHLYARHPRSGKVAHYILTGEPPFATEDDRPNSSDVNVPVAGPDQGILFYKEEEFEEMRHILWLMCYTLGPSTLASIRGLAYRAYTHTDLSNRFFSQLIDGSMLAASLMLQAPESDSDGRIPILRAGPITAIPPGWQATQSSFTPNFQHLASIRDMSAGVMHNNLGTFRRRPESIRPTQQTAAEVNAEMNQESEAKQNRATYRMRAWSLLHKEIFRRVARKKWLGGMEPEEFVTLASEQGFDVDKIVKEMDSNVTPEWKDIISFFTTLVRYGFPLNLLFDTQWSVEANRGFGAGSRSARLQAIQDILPLAATAPKERQNRLRHAYVLERTANPELADELYPPGDVAMDSREFLQAVMENNDMKEGREIPVPVEVDHVIHFETHVSMYFEDIKAWQQDPNEQNTRELYALASNMVPHIGMHLEYIAQDPVTMGMIERLKPQFERVIAVAGEIQKVAQQAVGRNQENRDQLAAEIQQLRAQADTNQTKTALRAQEIQNEFQLEAIRAQGLNESRMMKTNAQLQTQFQKSQADEFRKQQSHTQELQRKLQTALAEQQRLQLQLEQLRIQNQKQRES